MTKTVIPARKSIVPYGKRASIIATLKLFVVLLCAGGNGIKFGTLWLLFKKRRVQSLALYMFSAASRTVLTHMSTDDLQMIVGLKTLKAELEAPFYWTMAKEHVHFNTSYDSSHVTEGAKVSPDLKAPMCQWLWQVEDRKPSDPVIYFIHGGAFALSLCFAQIYWMQDLVKALPARHRVSVLAVDYSLSPYAKYPTQVHEAFYGYEALAKTCNKIITLGDSAGGALCAALAITLRDYPELQKKLYAQMYISPWAELLPANNGSVKRNAESDWVSPEFAARCAGWYVDRDVDLETETFTVSVTDPRADIGAADSKLLCEAFPTRTACVWSANELLADACQRFVEKAKITDHHIGQESVHDILYFGHNNDSSKYVVGVFNKWLGASDVKDIV